MSTTTEVSVLLPDGRQLWFGRYQHDSQAEFDGWLLCKIEELITGKRLTVPPKGTRWAEWHNTGGRCRCFMTNSLGTVYEHTGEQYVDRYKRVPGLFSLDEARAALRCST